MDEWDALPAWKTHMYIEGLKEAGVIKDPDAPDEGQPSTGSTGKPAEVVADYASGFIPRGFKTRRAG